jgi:hypothetical protein
LPVARYFCESGTETLRNRNHGTRSASVPFDIVLFRKS